MCDRNTRRAPRHEKKLEGERAPSYVLRRPSPIVVVCAMFAGFLALALMSCQPEPENPVSSVTPTARQRTPTPAQMPTLAPAERQIFRTYAQGELLPDMRVPIQRSETGEGGWYVVIDSEEGWAQFLSRMGQPQEIWEPVRWEEEILIGALLGAREGRGHGITITDLDVDGVTVVVNVSFAAAPSDADPSWVTYPFHLVRVPRTELPLGPLTLDFVAVEGSGEGTEGRQLASQIEETVAVDILWLPGEEPLYPTPAPISPTLVPLPIPTSTPVPNLEVVGTLLEVKTDPPTLRIVPADGEWEYVDLMETTSVLSPDGQPATLRGLVPGATIRVIGYSSESRSIQAAHVAVLSLPKDDLGFAPYRPRTVTLSTIYDGCELPLSVDQISTTFPLSQTFGLTQTHALTEDGFVVVPAGYQTFAALYNDDQLAAYPVFISADSVMRLSQLLFGRIMRSTEQTRLLPELEMLDREMFELCWAQYESMQSSSTPGAQRIASAALHNAAYFAVPLALLDSEFEPPEVISPLVTAELALIRASAGITVSPLLALPGIADEAKLRVDYGQFSPTGHYAPCENCDPDAGMSRYYRAIAWHRLVAFRLAQREETLSAALIVHTLNTHSAPRILWQRVQATLSFFQGQESLLSPANYGALLAQVWGEITDLTAFADDEKLDEFALSVRAVPPPENTMWPWIWDWRPGLPIERDWVFLGRPYAIDTYVFQQVTGEYVGSPDNRRALPSSIDLASVLGSLEAYRIASEVGDTGREGYTSQVDKVRNELAALREARWTEELYWGWLYVYRALLQDKTATYPQSMRTTAWKRKELQTMFGSWVDVQHDADLLIETGEDAGTEDGGGAAPSWGYVEPQPEVYARLAALTRMIIDGLGARSMLSKPDRDALLVLESWLIFFQDVARRELTGQSLAAEEYQRLGEYGPVLEELARMIARGEPSAGDSVSSAETQTAVAVPVATAGEMQRIEAVGRVDEIYVVVCRDRKRYLARGGVYSHYEFAWPIEEPLTDAVWRDLLAAGEVPPRPVWASDFVIAE